MHGTGDQTVLFYLREKTYNSLIYIITYFMPIAIAQTKI